MTMQASHDMGECDSVCSRLFMYMYHGTCVNIHNAFVCVSAWCNVQHAW